MERKLFRSRKNRLFLGVCQGLGAYYRIDPVVVRVIAILITVASGFFPGIVAYFILALIIPLEGSTATTTQETFRENLADLEDSSKHVGEQFKKNNNSGEVPPIPVVPPSPPVPPSSAAPPASTAPQTPEPGISFPPPTRSNRGLYVVAIALVAVGIFFIIVNSFGWLWRYLWPLTLVVAGIIIIALVLTRKSSN